MTDAVVPQPPILVGIPRVELVDVGTWDISNAQGWHPTADDLAHAVTALDCPAVRRPVLKFGHTPSPGDPALGFVENLATADEGQLLVGDFAGVPGWLAGTDSNGQTVVASAYPDRSIEGEYDYVCQIGHTHPFVVHAVALLGVERPGVGTLQSLIDLYGTAPQPATAAVTATTPPKGPPMPEQVSAAATTDDVRRAYYAGPGQNWDLWIREMYVDPPELIVENDGDATLTRVAYAIDGDGAVTFADPQVVKVQYVAARAAADKPVIAWASHNEARPGQRPDASTPPTPAATSTSGSTTEQTEEVSMPSLSDDQYAELRSKLGIADENADATTVLAALDEALAERADPATQPPTLPDGAVTIDSAQLEELRVAATAGVEARDEQRRQHREQLVAAAVTDGRISPARKEHWLTQLQADPGSEQVLASLQKGLIPVAASGYTGTSGDDDLDAQLEAEIARLHSSRTGTGSES